MTDPFENPGTPPAPPPEAERLRRQRSRALVMALLLGAFVVLMFAITIVKIRNGG
jgi:hypothetical protein